FPFLNLISSIISSRLNPLKICHPNITAMFKKLCNKLELDIDFDDILDKYNVLSSRVGKSNTLDIFFPFDSNFMQESSKHLSKKYLFWFFVNSIDASSDFSEDLDESRDEVIGMSVSM